MVIRTNYVYVQRGGEFSFVIRRPFTSSSIILSDIFVGRLNYWVDIFSENITLLLFFFFCLFYFKFNMTTLSLFDFIFGLTISAIVYFESV